MVVASPVSRSELPERLRAALDDVAVTITDLERSRAQLAKTCEDVRSGRDGRTRHRNSIVARMEAQLETLRVIEQAKGVLIAQTGCTPDEAFDVLRRASQRTNVKVRDLAEQMVRRASSGARAKPRRPPG